MRLVVQHDQVSVTDVEAREMLTGVLGIKDVLIDNKRSTSGIGSTPTEVYVCIIKCGANESALVER